MRPITTKTVEGLFQINLIIDQGEEEADYEALMTTRAAYLWTPRRLLILLFPAP
jgi:hypothetical protein